MSAERPTVIDKEVIKAATSNYIECLALKPKSKVLIVTDQAISSDQQDKNVDIRRQMSSLISKSLGQEGHTVVSVELDHLMGREEMHDQTLQAIGKLDNRSGNGLNNDPLMVVYLGAAWDNRSGMYGAAEEQTYSREVKVAGSLGFSTGDCRVMSQLNYEKRAIVAGVNQYFENFFSGHPTGTFLVQTSGVYGLEYQLSVDYDTSIVPFHTDLGYFEDEYHGKPGNFDYLNIPGGEKYGPPYEMKKSKGQFVAEGIVFTVEEGMVVGVTAPDEVLQAVSETSQKTLVNKILAGGKMPLAELGLGFYAIAGVATYDDCSVLSREKGGPHGGMGVDPSDSSPESKLMKKLAGDFHHTDFVMDEPRIIHQDKLGQLTQFYPPQVLLVEI